MRCGGSCGSRSSPGLFDAAGPSRRTRGGRRHARIAAHIASLARRAVRESLVLLKNEARPAAVETRNRACWWPVRRRRPQPPDRRLDPDLAGHRQHQCRLSRRDLDPRRHSIRRHRCRGQRRMVGRWHVLRNAPTLRSWCSANHRTQSSRAMPRTCSTKPDNGPDLALLRALEGSRHPGGLGFPERPSTVGQPPPECVRRPLSPPGCRAAKAAGVADVLFRGNDGRVAHDFRGRLSYSWPRRADQTPLNVGDRVYDPLFAYGYGLSYAAPARCRRCRKSPASVTALGAGRRVLRRMADPWRVM